MKRKITLRARPGEWLSGLLDEDHVLTVYLHHGASWDGQPRLRGSDRDRQRHQIPCAQPEVFLYEHRDRRREGGLVEDQALGQQAPTCSDGTPTGADSLTP